MIARKGRIGGKRNWVPMSDSISGGVGVAEHVEFDGLEQTMMIFSRKQSTGRNKKEKSRKKSTGRQKRNRESI
jgi:hypothetical protein